MKTVCAILAFLAVTAMHSFGQSDVQKRCIVTLELRQVHYTLSLTEHAKDALNAATFDIPVDREFYDTVKVGDVLSDKFRSGSLFLNGSFGKWKVTVRAKRQE